MSTVNMAQPSATTNVQYFGTAPYPTNAPLRAGNNAGNILGYRNFVNTLDLPGITIAAPASDASNHDYIILGGAIAAQFFGGAGRVIPTVDSVVSLGDTFQAYSQIVARALTAVVTESFFPFNRVVGGYQLHSSGTATPATQYAELSDPLGRLVFTSGSNLCAIELLSSGGTNINNFQPTSTSMAVGVALGSAARQWQQLFLLPSAAVAGAPLHMGQGITPTTPANGDIWLTSAGVFAQVAGATVGPFAPAGAGSVILQNNGTPLAGGPFSTLDFLGGGLVDLGGGVASVPAGGGGLTGGGTAGTMAIWTGATALGDSQFADGGATVVLTGRNLAPDADNSKEVGARNRNWSTVWGRRFGSDDTLIIESGDFGGNVGGIIESGGFPQLAWSNQTSSGSGVEILTTFNAAAAVGLNNNVDGAAASIGLLLNAPHAGNPDAWLEIYRNGVKGWVPWWHA